MEKIVDWTYYSSLYSAVSREEFDAAEQLAEKEVRLLVGPRWNNINPDAFYYDQLKDCICNTIDYIAKVEKSAAGRGISSVSNDGYTESYVLQTPDQARAELQRSIRAWLSGTGLVGAYSLRAM